MPRGLPVDCEIEGVLLTDVEAGKPAYLAGMERGDLVDSTFATSPVTSVVRDEFTTADSTYSVEPIAGEPGEFSILATILLRELEPGEAQAL